MEIQVYYNGSAFIGTLPFSWMLLISFVALVTFDFLFCALSALIIFYSGNCLFGTMYASFTLIGTSFFTSGKFSSMILLKPFSMPLT